MGIFYKLAYVKNYILVIFYYQVCQSQTRIRFVFDGILAEKKTYRVNRGGSWNNNDSNCRVANRNNNNANNRNNNLGFRLARALVAQENFLNQKIS